MVMPIIRNHAEALSLVKGLRQASGWSQQRLATLLGLRQSTIGNYEAGSNQMSVDVLVRIADVFGYDVVLVPRDVAAVQAEAKRLLERLRPPPEQQD